MKPSQIFQIILITLFGMTGSILVGFVFFNTAIFSPELIFFQFVVNGIIGSLFFGLLKVAAFKEQMLGIILIMLFDFIILLGDKMSLALVIRDVFYLSGLFLSIKLYFQFVKSNTKIKYLLRSFALAIIYSILTIISGSIVYLFNADFEIPPYGFIMQIAKIALLIGFGTGLGIEIYLQYEDKILKRLNAKTI